VLQPNDWFGIMPIFLYQRTKDGNPQDGWNQWASFGARPVVFFTKHLSLAFEAGFDHTESGANQYDGWLRKFTLAPQIGAGRKFSVGRYACFRHLCELVERISRFCRRTSYLNRTNGLTYGVQTENWW